MVKRVCPTCQGDGFKYKAAARVPCKPCDGKGNYEDGKFDITEFTGIATFIACLLLMISLGVWIVYKAKPLAQAYMQWAFNTGPAAFPITVAALLLLVWAGEGIRWLVTWRTRRLGAVKYKLNSSL